MRSLVELATASRNSELMEEIDRWKRAKLCDVCRREMPQGKGARKRHDECQKEYLKRQRAGWAKPRAHKAIVQRTPDPAIVAARAEFHAAVAASREARRKLKALVARGGEIPNGM